MLEVPYVRKDGRTICATSETLLHNDWYLLIGLKRGGWEMANVFTKRTKKARSTTLSDFCGPPITDARLVPRPLSPTRIANPHPLGLVYQLISASKTSYGIWHPNFNKINSKQPVMKNHNRWVNFCCGRPLSPYKMQDKAPEVIYTENTEARVSYCNPSRFPSIRTNQKVTRFGYTPNTMPVIGIIPSLKPRQYEPVQDQL